MRCASSRSEIGSSLWPLDSRPTSGAGTHRAVIERTVGHNMKSGLQIAPGVVCDPSRPARGEKPSQRPVAIRSTKAASISPGARAVGSAAAGGSVDDRTTRDGVAVFRRLPGCRRIGRILVGLAVHARPVGRRDAAQIYGQTRSVGYDSGSGPTGQEGSGMSKFRRILCPQCHQPLTPAQKPDGRIVRGAAARAGKGSKAVRTGTSSPGHWNSAPRKMTTRRSNQDRTRSPAICRVPAPAS